MLKLTKCKLDQILCGLACLPLVICLIYLMWALVCNCTCACKYLYHTFWSDGFLLFWSYGHIYIFIQSPSFPFFWSSGFGLLVQLEFNKNFFKVFVCKRVKPCTVIRKASLVISPIEMIITYFYSVRAINIFIVLLLTLSVALNKQFCILNR